jgi:hypothetical protein
MAIRAIPICLSHGFWTRRVIKLGWERRQTGGVRIHTSVVLVHSFATIFAHTNGNVVSARDARRHQRDQTRIHKRRRQASSHVISDYSAHLYLPTDVPHDQLFPFVPSDHRSLRIIRRHQPQLDARRALHWGCSRGLAAGAQHHIPRCGYPTQTRSTPPRRLHPSLAGVSELLYCRRGNRRATRSGRCWDQMRTAFSTNSDSQIPDRRTLMQPTCQQPPIT